MNVRRLIVVLALTLTGASALAADVTVTETFPKELPIDGAGSVLLNSLVGNVEIHGTSEGTVSLVAEKTVRGVDRAAVDEGRRLTELRMNGDQRGWMFSTIVPAIRSPRWTSSVKYILRVPRTIDVNVASFASERILVEDIRGSVTITNVHGDVILKSITGVSVVDSANGNILFMAPEHGMSSAQLRSVNGNVEVHAPRDANFQWFGESVRGDVSTTFPVRLRPVGNNGFRGSVNAAGGPTITTATLMGSIHVIQNGTRMASAKPVRFRDSNVPSPRPQPLAMPSEPVVRELVEGFFAYTTPMGSIRIKEIRGSARVSTGAGEINLGSVFGNCQVIASGPLTLGEILGSLDARTEGGDILVQAANKGGIITTGGGIIRLLYTNGPTRLMSGGGDIVVRQASASVSAETRSGDITITLDPSSKSERISAKTYKGNVLLNVTRRFAGDIDATVITNDPDANRFKSDFPQLSVQRDQIGGKTRFRITGKVNGGGEKVELYAEDGGIQITTNSGLPISVIAPH